MQPPARASRRRGCRGDGQAFGDGGRARPKPRCGRTVLYSTTTPRPRIPTASASACGCRIKPLEKRSARSRKCTSEPPWTPPSRRTACVRQLRWPCSEPTVTSDPAGSPGVFPTATRERGTLPTLGRAGAVTSGSRRDRSCPRSAGQASVETPPQPTPAACPRRESGRSRASPSPCAMSSVRQGSHWRCTQRCGARSCWRAGHPLLHGERAAGREAMLAALRAARSWDRVEQPVCGWRVVTRAVRVGG
jgi:hypothetical protein